MIGPKLRLKAIRRVAEGSGHHACVGDNHVEELPLCQQLLSAGSHALEAGQIQRNQLEASTGSHSIFSDLCGRRFGLFQIARRAHHICAMRGQRSCRLNAQPCRNAGYEDSFALQIHAGQNLIRCRSRSKHIHHIIHILSPSDSPSSESPGRTPSGTANGFSTWRRKHSPGTAQTPAWTTSPNRLASAPGRCIATFLRGKNSYGRCIGRSWKSWLRRNRSSLERCHRLKLYAPGSCCSWMPLRPNSSS